MSCENFILAVYVTLYGLPTTLTRTGLKVVKSESKKAATDGRVQRSERSRQLIIDAMLELVNEGVLVPTAQQVADRASVAIRTVFRHFSEMELLFNEMDVYMRPMLDALFAGGDRTGTLEERVLQAVERHADAYEQIAPVVRSTHSQAWRWPTLLRNYVRNQRRLRKDLDGWLPELKNLPTETREAIDGITSFEFWERLHIIQGLQRDAVVTLKTNLILQLINQGK